MRRYILFAILLYCSYLHAQLAYPIVGVYKNKSAQAMAIWGNTAFLFSDGGHVRLLNLAQSKVVGELDIASANANTHSSAACFGVESDKNNYFPYLYVSECTGPCRLFVENISMSKSSLVQTISAKLYNKNFLAYIWSIDRSSNILYGVTRPTGDLNSDEYPTVLIYGFRLPRISEGRVVTLTEKDVVSQFEVQFPNVTQDATIRDGKMYLVTGLQESLAGRIDAVRALHIIDLTKREIIKTVDLTYMTTNEPEGTDFYKNTLLMYCSQEGGIYKLEY